jgi:hypothetical protein
MTLAPYGFEHGGHAVQRRARARGDDLARLRVPLYLKEHRREYVEWVEDARRPRRERRIAATVAGAREGKHR